MNSAKGCFPGPSCAPPQGWGCTSGLAQATPAKLLQLHSTRVWSQAEDCPLPALFPSRHTSTMSRCAVSMYPRLLTHPFSSGHCRSQTVTSHQHISRQCCKSSETQPQWPPLGLQRPFPTTRYRTLPPPSPLLEGSPFIFFGAYGHLMCCAGAGKCGYLLCPGSSLPGTVCRTGRGESPPECAPRLRHREEMGGRPVRFLATLLGSLVGMEKKGLFFS